MPEQAIRTRSYFMNNKLSITFHNSLLTLIGLLVFSTATSAQAIERVGSGANPAAIQDAVDQFRVDLGDLNPPGPHSFTSGRREINWDAVSESLSAPNVLPTDFF